LYLICNAFETSSKLPRAWATKHLLSVDHTLAWSASRPRKLSNLGREDYLFTNKKRRTFLTEALTWQQWR